MKKRVLLTMLFCFMCGSTAYAGFGDFLHSLVDRAKDKVEGKVQDKEDSTVDKAADKVLNGDITNNDGNNQNNGNNAAPPADNQNGNWNTAAPPQDNGQNAAAGTNQPPRIISYRNYDFVPGDKVIFESQLADEQAGEIPSQFTLQEGQIDVENEDGENVIHIPKGPEVIFTPRMTSKSYVPDQFTVEFDVKNESWGLNHFSVRFGDGDNAIPEISFTNDDVTWTTGGATYPPGLTTDGDHPMVWHHIAIAVNKSQGKVYVDQYRVVNVNNITGKATAIIFRVDGYENSFVKNIRIAAGGIDMYKKVATDGKIVTHGILFDVDQATIKPQSMGTINRIFALLKKDPTLKFEIDGHTDNTGNAQHNLELSQQRADAVKDELVTLGIDASRLSTKGYGDTRPISSNDTPEGKANNRRVEFIRM